MTEGKEEREMIKIISYRHSFIIVIIIALVDFSVFK